MSIAIQCDWCHEYAPCPMDRFRAQVTSNRGERFEITITVKQILQGLQIVDIEADLCKTFFWSLLQ